MAKVKLKARIQCGRCFKPVLRKDCGYNENGKAICPRCWTDDDMNVTNDVEDRRQWYVIQVEPGAEARIRLEIGRQARIHGLQKFVGRVFAPAMLVDKVLDTVSEVLETGYAATAPEAQEDGNNRLFEFMGNDAQDWSPDGSACGDATSPASYKVSVYPAKGLEKGKIGNRWMWQLRKVTQKRRVVTGRVKKYPGYLIANMEYTKEVDHMLNRLRSKGVWGLLIRPVVLGYKVQVTQGKTRRSAGGDLQQIFNWKVRHPNTGEIEVKGREFTRSGAYEKAKAEKARLEEFQPTALASQEAAEHLIAQKAVNQICNDREEKNRKILNYKEGDTVKVVSGPFKGLSAKVITIDKTDKTDPKIKVEVVILHHPIKVDVACFDLSK